LRYQYLVILKKSSERATDLLSVLLCLFTAISFLYFALVAEPREAGGGLNTRSYGLIAASVLLLAGMVINVLRRRYKGQVRYRYLLLIAGTAWIALTTMPWMVVLFFLLAFLEYQTKRPLEIGFDQDIIVINTLIRQRFGWGDLTNVVLKDGLLTLDFVNNRLIQKEVADEDEDEDDASEEEFNLYCRERLAAVGR
jgi:hypothetical protein